MAMPQTVAQCQKAVLIVLGNGFETVVFAGVA